MQSLRFNVPKMFIGCLDCRRQVEVARLSGVAEITVPCECGTKGPMPCLALLLVYPSQKEPFAIHPLQEGPPGWRS